MRGVDLAVAPGGPQLTPSARAHRAFKTGPPLASQAMPFQSLLVGDGLASRCGDWDLARRLVSVPSRRDGLASALHHNTSYSLAERPERVFFADWVSAAEGRRSANLVVTTHPHNSLRTRILRTASSAPLAPVQPAEWLRRISCPACRTPPQRFINRDREHLSIWDPVDETHVLQTYHSPLPPATCIPRAAAGDCAQLLPRVN